jgi:hypothetical protein
MCPVMFQMDLEGLVEEIEQRVTARIRQELGRTQTPTGYLNVRSAATFLDTTPAAVRGLVKRGEIVPYRTPNGRLLFSASVLTEWAEGRAA